MPPFRQTRALLERQQDFESAQLLRFRNRVHTCKMKNHLAAMVLVQPAGFEHGALRLAIVLGRTKKNFL